MLSHCCCRQIEWMKDIIFRVLLLCCHSWHILSLSFIFFLSLTHIHTVSGSLSLFFPLCCHWLCVQWIWHSSFNLIKCSIIPTVLPMPIFCTNAQIILPLIIQFNLLLLFRPLLLALNTNTLPLLIISISDVHVVWQIHISLSHSHTHSLTHSLGCVAITKKKKWWCCMQQPRVNSINSTTPVKTYNGLNANGMNKS